MIKKLIDANELKREMCRKCIDTDEETEKGRAKWNSGLWIRYKVFEDAITLAPTVDAVPLEDYKSMEQTVYKLTKAIADAEFTGEQVKEYCRKRNLLIVGSEVFNEMKARWGAEPVVRCKNCKFFDHSDFGKGEEYWCKHFVSTDDYAHCHKVIEDDFCSWGERKEDAKT